MPFFIQLCLLLLSILASTSDLPLPHHRIQGNYTLHDIPAFRDLLDESPEQAEVFARWFSVPDLPTPPHKTPWGPWPLVCPGMQPVRYCFKDARSEKNLKPVIDAAVARYTSALEVSTLSFILDNEASAVCSDDESVVRGDALIVSDETKDGEENDDFNWDECDTQATTGYDYRSEESGRHTLEFCHLKPGYEGKTREASVRAMMHELGHVVGLQHEHQRPDRQQYLFFVCKNLEGYDAGVWAADIDEQVLFDDDMPIKERIASICGQEEFARAYLPSALPFLMSTFMDDPRWSTYITADTYDYDTIMSYSSTSGAAKQDPSNYKTWVLSQKPGGRLPVWMGGAREPERAKLSAGDVHRIKEMYKK